MRIAVAGATGPLGAALIEALGDSPFTGPFGPLAWGRRELDLDEPDAAARRLARDRVELVIHAAPLVRSAAPHESPSLGPARARPGVADLAVACAARGVDLLLVSCASVFGALPADGLAHRSTDDPTPLPASVGAAVLDAECAAAAAYAAGGARGRLGLVRTGELFGCPGRDRPTALLLAALAARDAGEPLRVPAGPVTSPTSLSDLAEAICELIAADAVAGVHHLVNGGSALPAAIATELLRHLGFAMTVVTAPSGDRDEAAGDDSDAVSEALAATPLPSGEPMPDWRDSLAVYVPSLVRWVRSRG